MAGGRCTAEESCAIKDPSAGIVKTPHGSLRLRGPTFTLRTGHGRPRPAAGRKDPPERHGWDRLLTPPEAGIMKHILLTPIGGADLAEKFDDVIK